MHQGGSTVRLFHKELEAYLVAEGLFDWYDLQTGWLSYIHSFLQQIRLLKLTHEKKQFHY